jgi:hypothetical protein
VAFVGQATGRVPGRGHRPAHPAGRAPARCVPGHHHQRSEVRNTLRIEAGDQLLDLQRLIVDTLRAVDRQSFLVALRGLRLWPRAAGMPLRVIILLDDQARRAWTAVGSDGCNGEVVPLTHGFVIASEFVPLWLGTANAVEHVHD